MPIPESTSEWWQAMIIRFVEVDITLLVGHLHCFRVPATGGPCERCITGIHTGPLADITAFHLTSPKTISTISRMGAQCRPPDGQNLSRSRVYQPFFCLPSSQIALEQVIFCDPKLLASRGPSNISRNIHEKESGLGIRRGTS